MLKIIHSGGSLWGASLAFLTGCALLSTPAIAAEPIVSGPLYAGQAAGSQDWAEPRIVKECRDDVNIFNTREPRYAFYQPQADKASGAAVLLLPGGGLRVLGMGTKTEAEIEAFLDNGVAVLVLEYRTFQIPVAALDLECAPPNPNAPERRFPSMEIVNGNANPAPDNEEISRVLELATSDAQAALTMLHQRSAEWQIDPDRIGIIGTSAGGGVGFGAMLAGGPEASGSHESKPDFLISIFGPSLQDIHVPENAPPLFLVTESNHGPVTDGLLSAFSIWKAAGEKVELHVYEVPNFSMTVDLWGPRLFDWMGEQAILPPVAAEAK